jgi:beta-galactosidase
VPGKANVVPADWRYPWRAGESIWCGFDHGSIAGRKFGSMGLVDYARLPKRVWYRYRNAYRGIAPPVWPQPGTPAALRLTASSPVIDHADGTDDVQLVVTVTDADGRAISNSPPVRLEIESGPGELPTGRAITFTSDGDIPIRDGQAAIAMRSWQAEKTLLRATSPGLKDGMIAIITSGGSRFVPGKTPIATNRPYMTPKDSGPVSESTFGTDNPTGANSAAPGHATRLVNDGDPATYWSLAPGDEAPWVLIDTERVLDVHRLLISFPQAGGYGFRAEIQKADGAWVLLAEQAIATDTRKSREIVTPLLTGGRVRVRLLVPKVCPPELPKSGLLV